MEVEESMTMTVADAVGYEDPTALTEGQLLIGIPISPGVVAGRARVLATPDVGYIEPGSILVIDSFSTEWMGLLHYAGGVVAETASLLTDPAIVARELGVPVVGHIAFATQLISDGQTLVVDGDRGSVLIEA
jgi:rifampicin phosphotransferase